MADKDNQDVISKAKRDWEEQRLEKLLSKRPERKDNFVTGSNAEVQRLYTPNDVEGLDYLEDLGFPGNIPIQGVFSPPCTGVDCGP